MNHSSVRRFTEEYLVAEDLETIIVAWASLPRAGKIFSPIPFVVVQTEAKTKHYMTWYHSLPFFKLRQFCFVGTTIVPPTAAELHGSDFDAKGPENLLISSVDASLAGQNTLLAAESLGYGGVFIGLIRHKALAIAELFNLPDYTYPIFSIALGRPAQHHPVKPLPAKKPLFSMKNILEQGVEAINHMT